MQGAVPVALPFGYRGRQPRRLLLLREKPETSLLDLMGPWPWYIITAALLAIAMFAALDVPFRGRRRAPGRRVCR
jgi:uncharacterized membrane protein YwaF